MRPTGAAALLCILAASVAIPAFADDPATPPPAAAPSASPDAAAIYKKALPSVMTLEATVKDGVSRGTGFLAIDDGLAVTALHVVKGATKVKARFADGDEFDVSGIVDKDEARDVAIVKVKVSGRPLLPLASGQPEIGSKAFLIGAPRGEEFTLSDGVVSNVRIKGRTREYQFTCPASPGNSGGPLLNADGQVIGICDEQRTDGQNLNFAVAINYAAGLDISLPTAPWGRGVSDWADSQVATEILDECLAKALVLIAGVPIVAEYVDSQYISVKRNMKDGPPPCVHMVEHTAESMLGPLKEMEPTDKDRIKLWLFVVTRLDNAHEYGKLVSSALRYAGTYQWYSSAIDDARSGEGYLTGMTDWPLETIKRLKDSTAFVSALPVDVQIMLGLKEPRIPFNIGMMTFVDDINFVASVSDGGLAQKLGFKPDDRILSFAGHDFKSIDELKSIIDAASGMKVTALVERDKKKQEIKINVPTVLSSYR
jgi:S1-C subfamily serine protease